MSKEPTCVSTPTEWVVYCTTHRHYLVRTSALGTTWTADQKEARRYGTKPAARVDAIDATWLDHRPIVWAVASATGEV